MIKNNIEVDVKLKCIEHGVTQTQIAEEIETTGQYVNRIIKKKDGVVNKTFVSMMEALGYDIELTYVKKVQKSVILERNYIMSELIPYGEQFEKIIYIIESAKERAYRKVKEELILMYREIGKYISEQSENTEYGDAFVQKLADFFAIEEPRRATGNVFLDNYVLDFLDVPDTVSERDLQKSIIRNLKNFILEIGKDFTFIGEEKSIVYKLENMIIILTYYFIIEDFRILWLLN